MVKILKGFLNVLLRRLKNASVVLYMLISKYEERFSILVCTIYAFGLGTSV